MEEGNGTVVLSSVTFAPVPEDDNTFLKCVGDNPKLLGVGQEDSFKLNVVCKYFTTSYTKVPPQEILRTSSNILNNCKKLDILVLSWKH